MGLKVRLHRRVLADLEDIKHYLLEHAGCDAAERVRSHLRDRILRLGEHPEIGLPTSHPDIRILSPTRYPYRVYYTTTQNDVIVLHIRHTARRGVDVETLI